MRRSTEPYELDARKSLGQLYREWDGCTKCACGIRRNQCDTKMVKGEGQTRAIMLVGEGPGETEEAMGRPFVGESGYLLRRILEALRIDDLVYITNIVACRSCQQRMDNDGKPMFRTRGKGPATPVWENIPPPKPAVDACWPRFHQELYIVDPIVIMTLGKPATETLLGHTVNITEDHGKPETIEIEGVGFVPSFTEKKGAWIRSNKGVLTLPTNPAAVAYTVVPTIHPAYVTRKITDGAKESPFNQFSADMRLVVKIYERYMLEVHGTTPSSDSNAEVTCDDTENE